MHAAIIAELIESIGSACSVAILTEILNPTWNTRAIRVGSWRGYDGPTPRGRRVYMSVGTMPRQAGFDGSGRPEDWEAWTNQFTEDGEPRLTPPDTNVVELGRQALIAGGPSSGFDARLGTPFVGIRSRRMYHFIGGVASPGGVPPIKF